MVSVIYTFSSPVEFWLKFETIRAGQEKGSVYWPDGMSDIQPRSNLRSLGLESAVVKVNKV